MVRRFLGFHQFEAIRGLFQRVLGQIMVGHGLKGVRPVWLMAQ